MFAKSIGPALKIKIEAENPEASSGDRDKLKINMVGKLWRLLRDNQAHEQSENFKN